ncbi:MAG TPA: ABC transporter substrate-binding protein [Chloroflexota bacterium]|nr:ABC transporter substrate-binding protein [Chloroflexota bacterium]
MRYPCVTALAAAILLAGCAGQAGPAAVQSPAGSAAGAASAASPSGTGAADKVRFGINGTSTSTVLYWAAQSAGIFARNRLDVQLLPSAGRTSLNAVIAGDLEGLALGGPATVLIAIQHGAPLHIVAVPSDVYNVIIVAADGINSLDQLKGKRVGGQSETAIDVTGMKRVLHDAGLEAGKDYQYVDTGAAASGNGVVAALLAHQIDAAPLDDVTSQQALQQKGYHVLLDMADPRANIHSAFSVVALRDDFVQQHPDTAQRFVDSLLQGMTYMRDHKAETEQVIKTHWKVDDPAQVDSIYNRQIELLAKDPTPTKDELADAATYVPKGTPPIPASLVSSAIDPRLAQAALKQA